MIFDVYIAGHTLVSFYISFELLSPFCYGGHFGGCNYLDHVDFMDHGTMILGCLRRETLGLCT